MVKRPLYLLLGKEEFLKREALAEIRARELPSAGGFASDYEEFPSERGIGPFLDFLRTSSFLGGKRLGVFMDLEGLEADAAIRLVEALKSLPEGSVAAVLSSETNVKRDAAVKALSEIAAVVACHPPFDNDWPNWTAARARKKGLALDRAGAERLVERAGKDAAAVSNAIESLLAYAHPAKTAGARDVEALFGRSLQADAFRLVDCVVERDAGAALRLSSALQEQGTRAAEIVAVLSGQFERLRKAVEYAAGGVSPEMIGERLKIHPFYLDKTLRQAKRLGREGAKKAYRGLLECDESIKTGKLPEGLALGKFLSWICA
jgi:DNA polymerase III subunit delta